jgi:Lon-like ATP-dependent protease
MWLLSSLLRFLRRQKRKIIKKDYETAEPLKISQEKILKDMEAKNPKFDLRTGSYWRQSPDKFLQEFFDENKKYTTDDIRVPEKFKEWIIGQDDIIKRIDLMLVEWIHTLKLLQDMEKQEASGIKYSHVLRERPTTNILMIGSPGTGKSLIVKIMAEELKDIYKQENIELEDVILTEDVVNRYKANVRYLKPTGIGKKLVSYAEMKETQIQNRKHGLIMSALVGVILAGFGLLAWGLRETILYIMAGADLTTALSVIGPIYFTLGISMISMPLFILIFLKFGFIGTSFLSTSVDRLKTPNLIVDNDPKDAEYYENATIISDSLLFGEIEWDALQTPGLGIPPYKRAKAGLVHKANKKILYIDEIRNLTPSMAIKLLTIMEDGETPIRAQGSVTTLGGSSTAGQNLETPPIKSMFFLLVAGNNDIIEDKNSIINQMPALRDRFENYGDIIYLKDEVETSPENLMRMCQAVADELYRYSFPPMEAQGVKALLDFVRDKATDKNHIRLMFRIIIKIIKKSTQLCWNEGDSIIREKHVLTAIEQFSESIEHQMLTKELDKERPIKVVETIGEKIGALNGLAVVGHDRYHEGAGDVFAVETWLRFVDDEKYADYVISGAAKNGEDIHDSIKDVRTAIYVLYGIDISKHCYTHIKFSQTRVDGPSAGITMTLAIMSILGEPWKFKEAISKVKKLTELDLSKLSVPLRQDIAVTGALEILVETDKDIQISAVGGINEKIDVAERYGLKYVIIPQTNFDLKQKIAYKNIKILSAKTVLEYFSMIRGGYNEIW